MLDELKSGGELKGTGIKSARSHPDELPCFGASAPFRRTRPPLSLSAALVRRDGRR